MLEEEPLLVLMEAKSMDAHLALLLFPPRVAAALLTGAGALALGLAVIGLYGLVSHAVARRTREVGIRMALGGTSRDVILLMTSGGARLVATGAGIGMLLAALTTWPLARFLYGIGPLDVATVLAVTVLLGAVGVLASWIPARRASRVDPVEALRAD
jgi:ABC-type antimicrobial peptide transport system permease subunit